MNNIRYPKSITFLEDLSDSNGGASISTKIDLA